MHLVAVLLHFLGNSLAQWDNYCEDYNEIDNHDWPCDLNNNTICVPYGYNMKRPPIYQKNLRSKGIFVNFVLNSREGDWFQKDIKGVDINKMTFTFSPTLVIAWQDRRLKFCNHNITQEMEQWFETSTEVGQWFETTEGRQWFETSEKSWQNWLDIIWSPEISIENKIDESVGGNRSKHICI